MEFLRLRNDAPSDARIAHNVSSAVRDRIGRKGELLEISADKGLVTLRGVVTSFYEKQLSLHVAKRVSGVSGLRDELVVSYYD